MQWDDVSLLQRMLRKHSIKLIKKGLTAFHVKICTPIIISEKDNKEVILRDDVFMFVKSIKMICTKIGKERSILTFFVLLLFR